jgi:uncharacterized membrane protein YphA (DoxX/SURF4 family)
LPLNDQISPFPRRRSSNPLICILHYTDTHHSFLLAGRVLLIFLFLGFVIQGHWSIGRVTVSILGLIACVMVAIGFKAKWSAAFLVLVLSGFNVIVNNWWAVHSAHPQRDFLKYDFFQTLCEWCFLLNDLCLNFELMFSCWGDECSDCWWPTSPCQYGSGWSLSRREEESVLINEDNEERADD